MEYIYEKELPKSLLKVENKNGVVFPFLLENCDWKEWKIGGVKKTDNIELGKYQIMPMGKGARVFPLDSEHWTSKPDAWMTLIDAIRKFCGAPSDFEKKSQDDTSNGLTVNALGVLE